MQNVSSSNNQNLKGNDILLLKGIGILLIVLHNYFHWLPGYQVENEFHFNRANFNVYFINQFDGFFNFIKWNLAFWGHYGVELFIFASAWGLSQSKIISGIKEYALYLLFRLSKLFFLLAFGIILVSFIRFCNTGYFENYKVLIITFFPRVIGITNFNIDTIFEFSGPYWYFVLAAQLYIIFPFLFRIIDKLKKVRNHIIVLMIFLICNLIFVNFYPNFSDIYFANIIGHFPELILGIIIAIHPNLLKFNFWKLLVLAIFLVMAQIWEAIFSLSFFSATIFLLQCFLWAQKLWNKKDTWFYSILSLLGEISMSLFILNGAFRELKIFREVNNDLVDFKIILFIPLLLFFAIIINRVFLFLWNYYKKLVNYIIL